MVWAHKSSSDWWEQIVPMTWNSQQWLEMFRMKREMFYHIVLMLEPHIMRQDTNVHQAIPPDKRIATAIIKLASPSSFCYIVNQSGMAACTVGLATHEGERVGGDQLHRPKPHGPREDGSSCWISCVKNPSRVKVNSWAVNSVYKVSFRFGD
ncbi:hypothetical protein Y1Q_0000845 [Alligator mississippiensis]|nr:hypothetical protein Y1Q_0000845 [Alligator mississippiensis]